MSTDESAWSRRDSETMMASIIDPSGSPQVSPAKADDSQEDLAWLPAVGIVTSPPALALAAFAFAVAQLLGGLVPEQLASMIPSAADSPVNHVRIVSLFDLGMAVIAVALAAAALIRARDRARSDDLGAANTGWSSWVAGAAVVVSALVAFQAILLIILSALAPPAASS